jgi:hypothetical protein
MKKQKAKSDQRPQPMRTGEIKSSSKARPPRPSAPSAKAALALPASTHSESVWPRDELRQEAAPKSEARRWWRKVDAAAEAKYQRIYAAARVADGNGNVQLDQQRFAEMLADVVLDPLTEQELYTLALLAHAEGHASLFREEQVGFRTAS